MRAIVSAYDCAPRRGSEAGVGWNWIIQIARQGVEVHALTAARNRQAIEAAADDYADLPITFHYLGQPAPAAKISRHWSWAYYTWQLGAARYARQLHRERPFDLAHHLTYCNDWAPSGLAALKDIPFVWGPVGGSSHRAPVGVDLRLSARAERIEQQRVAAQAIAKRFDPFFRRTVAHADSIIVYTNEALGGISAAHRHKAQALVHIGVSDADLPCGYDRRRADRVRAFLDGEIEPPAVVASVADGHAPALAPMRIMTGGRLVHWKGYDLLLEGLRRHRDETGADTRLVITKQGEGGRQMVEQLIATNRLGDAVDLFDELPDRDAMYDTMATVDLFALPTWRDGPPTGVLEAMHAELPVLVLDHGATAELVPPSAGFKIPVVARAQIVADIAGALTQANEQREAAVKMGKCGRHHSLTYHGWDTVGPAIAAIYRSVLGH